jgi:putative (di)nucleoside polyphosphate hydrolase
MAKDHKKAPVSAADLPYRPCVGIAVFNGAGKVFVGRRADAPGEAEGPGQWWQMPQGGIDEGEDLLAAARRELWEETSIRTVSLIAEAPRWLTYDLPPELIGKAWGGRFRGQRQKWFALRLDGAESEIDVRHPGGGHHKAEFMAWKWEDLARLPTLVPPFKKAVYEEVVEVFGEIPQISA